MSNLIADAHRAIELLSYENPLVGDRAIAIAVIYKLIASYQGPEGYETWNEAAVDEKVKRLKAEKEIDLAFSMLAINGVPPERAKTVANGIDVLVTRMARENSFLREENADLKQDKS